MRMKAAAVQGRARLPAVVRRRRVRATECRRSDAFASQHARSASTIVSDYLGTAARSVREQPLADAALYTHPEWAASMPWLAQGITGSPNGSQDMSWFGATPVGELQTRWRLIRDVTQCATSVHARQVHGAEISCHEALPPGVVVVYDVDGHATSNAGVLLCVSVADCVPILIVDPLRRIVAALHAGWRGVAAGMLEAGLSLFASRGGSQLADLRIHFGPAICGACYEVGAEVPVALGLNDPGAGAKVQLDVRGVLNDRARAFGVPASSITASEWCTRCGDSPFFSHRAGQADRQMAVIGIRG
jgi:YfiH family protein